MLVETKEIEYNNSIHTKDLEDSFTKLRVMTSQLSNRDEILYSLMNFLPFPCWITEADGKVIYYNAYWRKTTGQTHEESLGDGWVNVIHPEDKDRAYTKWLYAKNHPDADYQGHCRFKNKEGTYYYHTYQGIPIKDNGKVIAWVGYNIVHDNIEVI